jgi:poly(3-hydroxybutyrate) depolymerase
MTYFLAEPNVYDTSQKYPVVVSLHGSGGNGQNSMGQRFLTDSDHNAWVIAPTSPENTVLSQTSHQS